VSSKRFVWFFGAGLLLNMEGDLCVNNTPLPSDI